MPKENLSPKILEAGFSQGRKTASPTERALTQAEKLAKRIEPSLSQVNEQAQKASTKESFDASITNLEANIADIKKDLGKAPAEKIQGLTEELAEELATLKIWQDRKKTLFPEEEDDDVQILEAEEEIDQPTVSQKDGKTPINEEQLAEGFFEQGEEENQKLKGAIKAKEAEANKELENLIEADKRAKEKATPAILSEEPILPEVKTAEISNEQPEKKSWIPARLRNFGLMALAAFGLGKAVINEAPQLEKIGEDIIQTMDSAGAAAADLDPNARRIGLEKAVRAAREVKHVRDQALKSIPVEEAQLQAEVSPAKTQPKQKASRTVKAEPTSPITLENFDRTNYRKLLDAEQRTAEALDIPHLKSTILKEKLEDWQRTRENEKNDLAIALGILNQGLEGPQIEETKKAVAEYVGRQAALQSSLDNLKVLDEVEREAKLASLQKDLDKFIEKRNNLSQALENLNQVTDFKGKSEQLLSGQEVEIAGKKVRLDTSDLNS